MTVIFGNRSGSYPFISAPFRRAAVYATYLGSPSSDFIAQKIEMETAATYTELIMLVTEGKKTIKPHIVTSSYEGVQVGMSVVGEHLAVGTVVSEVKLKGPGKEGKVGENAEQKEERAEEEEERNLVTQITLSNAWTGASGEVILKIGPLQIDLGIMSSELVTVESPASPPGRKNTQKQPNELLGFGSVAVTPNGEEEWYTVEGLDIPLVSSQEYWGVWLIPCATANTVSTLGPGTVRLSEEEKGANEKSHTPLAFGFRYPTIFYFQSLAALYPKVLAEEYKVLSEEEKTYIEKMRMEWTSTTAASVGTEQGFVFADGVGPVPFVVSGSRGSSTYEMVL